MPPRRWKLLEGAAYGLILGLLVYAALGLTRGVTGEPAGQLKALAVYCLGGALIGCVAVWVRNRIAWRGFMSNEKQRGLQLHEGKRRER
jgi:hypothetical protein